MAQVRILQDGGTPTDQVDLFEWEGVGKYERKPMIQTLTKNLAGYADHLGLTGDRRNRFMTNGAAAIKALEAGQLRKLADGSYSDASGTMSSTGKYDKNWLGKLKDTDNNAYNDIAGYFDAYMSKASVYDPEKAKKEAEARAKEGKTKFTGDTYLRDRLAQQYYAGTFNTADWFDHRDETGRLTGIADVLDAADYNAIYGKYLWDDTGIDSADTLRARAQALSTNLRNGELNNADYNTAAALGINLDTFLNKSEPAVEDSDREKFIKQKLEQGYTQDQAERLWELEQNKNFRDKEAAMREAEDKEAAALEDAAWKQWYSQHNNPNIANLAGVVFGDNVHWSPDSVVDRIQKEYNGNTEAYLDIVGKVLSGKAKYVGKSARDTQIHNLRTLKFAYDNVRGYFGNPISENEYIIPGTLDTSNYIAYIYNPSTNSYRQVNLLSNSAYENFVKGLWIENNRKASHKEGGVIKMQDGGYADYQRSLQEGRNDVSAWFQEAYNAREQRRANEKKAKRQPDPTKPRDYVRTGDQIEAGKRQLGGSPAGEYQWTTADKVRLGTIGADVLSTIASFVPGYGTVASAVLGVTSTAANFGADLSDDSVSIGQAFGNLGMGLGMDLVGLIPGVGVVGKAGKISKMIKPISRGLIWTLRGIGTAQAYNSIGAINKLLTTPDKMTVDDWRDVAGGVQAVMGYANYRSGKRAVARNTTERQVVDIYGADRKKYTISQENYEKLRNTQGKKAQDKLFNELTGSDKGLTREIKGSKKVPMLGWNIPGTGNNPGHSRTELHWMDAPEAPRWDGFGYNKGDKAFIDFYNKGRFSGPVSRPTASSQSSAGSRPKKRIQALGEGETRARQGNNVIRTKKLTDAEIKQINKNRKAAGLPPLSQKEIDAINARAANNTPTQAPTLQERLQQRRHDREHSVEADVARARQEIEAANRLAQRPAIAAQAQTMVANQTIPARMGLQDFINSSIPGRQSSGAARASRQRMYEGLWPSSTALVSSRTVQPRMSTRQVIDRRVPKKPTPKGRARRQKDLEAAFADPAQFRGSDRAKFIVQDQTRPAKMSTKKLIESRFPKKPATGAARKGRQKTLEKLLGPLQKADNKKVGIQKAAKTKAAKKKAKVRDEKLATMGGAYKFGGRLIPKFQNPSGPISNIESTADWLVDIYGTDAFKNWLGSYNEQNYEDFNTLQKQWYANRQATGFDPSDKTKKLSYNQEVYDRQGKFNEAAGGINQAIEALAGPNGKIIRAGRSGDNANSEHPFQDGLFGFQEFLRHGGYKDLGLTEAQQSEIDKLVAANNLEYYFDPTTGMGMLKLKQKPKEDSPASPEVTAISIDPKVEKSSKSATLARAVSKKKSDSTGSNWSLLPEDVLATSRAFAGIGANARAAKQTKAGMRPLITDTWENVVSPEWDYFAQRAGEDAYAGLTSFAGRARTANFQDQFAGQLEAENKGRQFIVQGNQQAANRFYQTDRMRQQESDAAKARRVENNNANMGRMLSVDAAKHNVDAALTTAQYAQILAPWMAGIENQYRQNRAAQRQMDASAYQRALLASMQADYDKAVESGDKDAVKRVTDQYYKDLQEYNRRAYSSPWLIQRTTSMPSSNEYGWIDYAKEGGRLTAREKEVIQRARDFNKRMLADNKQFHKDIMESKREHNKLIAGMSNLTADLIKNGMKWK